jgi:hypothetical protein
MKAKHKNSYLHQNPEIHKGLQVSKIGMLVQIKKFDISHKK